ncbi:MAG TPA: hypothetical protein VM620_06540 [Hyphomicrobium sp.]|jgi:hypothetical protein|nr:hypothetical protein [Hyphomicrobium sp.]
MREGDPRVPRPKQGWSISPVASLIVGVLALTMFIYSFGNQPSDSEKYGTVTQSEAEDGVTPSLPPDGRGTSQELRESDQQDGGASYQ